MLSDKFIGRFGTIEREETAYCAWFQSIPKIGDVTLFLLYEKFGSMKEAYKASERELRAILKPAQYSSFLAFRYVQSPMDYLKQIEQKGIRYIPFFDALYPQKLRDIPDPPFGLFVKGKLPQQTVPSVAMIGARACSEYGKCVAKLFASELAAYGVQIISGMARGIDSVSQQTCLECGGQTFSVLGNGVDICYPDEMRSLYEGIALSGGLLSSYAPGMPPLSVNFPPRNRIISGLSDVVLVVEARQKSGTLITVDMALEQGKEVAVIPGRITDELSRGCHDLIHQGATVITQTEQLLELLQQVGIQNKYEQSLEKQGAQEEVLAALPMELKQIFRVLTAQLQSAEVLYTKWKEQKADGDFQTFMEGLMDLELMDLCKSEKNRFQIR